MKPKAAPDLILHNGKITTLDPKRPEAKNLAVKGSRIVGVDVAGFGAGHRDQPEQTKDDPAGKRLRAAYDPRDHVGIIHPSDMRHS